MVANTANAHHAASAALGDAGAPMTSNRSHASWPTSQQAAASANPLHGARPVPSADARASSRPATAHAAAAVHATSNPTPATGRHTSASAIATTAITAAATLITLLTEPARPNTSILPGDRPARPQLKNC